MAVLAPSSTQHSIMVSSTGAIVDAVAAQDGHVVLDVLADLQHRRVFEQRFEPPEGFLLGKRARAVRRRRATAEIEAALGSAGAVQNRNVVGDAGGE